MVRNQEGAGESELILRGRKANARFRGRDIVLERGDGRWRIPLTAVERVHVSGDQLRTAEIMLTPAGEPATVYRLECRSSAAVAAFAAAVEAALPERMDNSPRQNGADLVELLQNEESQPDPERSGIIRARLAVLYVLIVYLAGLAVLFAAGMGAGRIAGYAVGTVPLGWGIVFVWINCKGAYNLWVLRQRGITVVATFHRREYQRKAGSKNFYRFADTEGNSREYSELGRPVREENERIELSYDPQCTERMAPRLSKTIRTFKVLGFIFLALPLLGVGLFLVPGALIYALLF
ncbi:hypothetical protein [Streptomyces sp. NBC_01643]|uniref:hypothetical protein n=1 Tax=Streptomyces sp. NBC_01643 TaxID=2975906 RepID=UPI00386CF2B6|nr:hypothetical protein OHB03_47390 [Streptomyces sp. NBC_01643]